MFLLLLLFVLQDMCVGDFWETVERREIATFTTAMVTDQFTIMTIPDPSASDGVIQGAPAVFPVQRYLKEK